MGKKIGDLLSNQPYDGATLDGTEGLELWEDENSAGQRSRGITINQLFNNAPATDLNMGGTTVWNNSQGRIGGGLVNDTSIDNTVSYTVNGLLSNGAIKTARNRSLLIGSTTKTNVRNAQGNFQLHGEGGDESQSSFIRYGSNRFNHIHKFAKTRASYRNVGTAVQDGDNIGSIEWYGDDGGGLDLSSRVALLRVSVDGAVSSNTVPGRMLFQTTDGSGNFLDALEILSSQDAYFIGGGTLSTGLAVGNADTSYDLHVGGSGIRNNGTLSQRGLLRVVDSKFRIQSSGIDRINIFPSLRSTFPSDSNGAHIWATDDSFAWGGFGGVVIQGRSDKNNRGGIGLAPNTQSQGFQWVLDSGGQVGNGILIPAFEYHQKGGTYSCLGAPASSPATSNMGNGSIIAWLDEASQNITIEVKESGGNTFTATLSYN